MNDIKFDFDDMVIEPEVLSSIGSRKECEPYVYSVHSTLPLMTAPMYDVVSLDNYEKFVSNNIIPILPRGIANHDGYLNCYQARINFSIGLVDVENIDTKILDLLDKRNNSSYLHRDYAGFVLIDCANGHMIRLLDILKDLHGKYPYIKFVVGNISNPNTFKHFAEAGAWGVRLGIGNGSACTTTANVAVGYPLGALIKETYDIKAKYNLSTKIIADGGFKNYSDIIKAIVLGADFVMVGGELNKLTDTQNYGYLYNKFVVSGKVKQMAHRLKLPVYHDYRGMSTKLVQQMENKKKLVTSEGISKRNLSKSTLHQWTQNFTDYLRSAMSYSNCRTLEEFIGNQNYVLISQNSYKRFNK